MNLYDETLELLSERKFLKVNQIVPTYVCSIGAHMFNYVNKAFRERDSWIYTYGGNVPDMRLHVFMVTIPGFGKSYIIDQFMSRANGLLADTDIRTSKLGSLTSAGLVGSVRSSPDGNVIVSKGVLQRKKEYVLGSGEFSNITTSARSMHSTNLINDLLDALDSGEMNKDQSAGGIEYDTYATVWGATQTRRFDLRAGLPRRFAFVVYMPTVQDAYAFRDVIDQSMNLKLNLNKLLEYKLGINARFKEVKENLKKIEFDPEIKKWLRSSFGVHYEDLIYYRIILGYWIMKSDSIGESMFIKMNDEVKAIVEQQMDARLQVQKGVRQIQIMDVIKHVKSISYKELMKLLLSFTLDEEYINRALEALNSLGIIHVDVKNDIVKMGAKVE